MRDGGAFDENVLTAEVLQALHFLPRDRFLGRVLLDAVPLPNAPIDLLANEVEAAVIELLPGDMWLEKLPGSSRSLNVQPDAIIESPSVYCLVEAKKYKGGSFQAEQLAREFLLAIQRAGSRRPLVLLILDAPPPVAVQRMGRIDIASAVEHGIAGLLPDFVSPAVMGGVPQDLIEQTFAWTTWDRIAAVVGAEQVRYSSGDSSVDAAIARLSESLLSAISRQKMRQSDSKRAGERDAVIS